MQCSNALHVQDSSNLITDCLCDTVKKKCNNKINKIKRKKYIYIDEINTLLNTHT